MDKANDYEGAVVQLNNSIHELESVILTDRFEGVKILEFLLSFNPEIYDQNEKELKDCVIEGLKDEMRNYARIIMDNSIKYEIPFWNLYEGKIKRVIEHRFKIWSE